MNKRYHYLVKLQFLGFRYSGWQKQPGQKTIEGMLLKTLKFVLPDRKFKLLGAGRTDAKVSALDAAFELFLEENPLSDENKFLEKFNKNLPPDIKVISISNINNDFNIIQADKLKTYRYLFSFGAKNHPFCAPFMASFLEKLDIGLMKEGAILFEGRHNFKAYTVRAGEGRQFNRLVASCKIAENNWLKANFFPDNSYVLEVIGSGFMRYQIRMIMGALVQLGRGELSLDQIKTSLKNPEKIEISFVAPGSGLILNKIEFRDQKE